MILLMMICRLFGHGETERKWYEWKESFSGRHGEYITSCKRCGMITRIER